MLNEYLNKKIIDLQSNVKFALRFLLYILLWNNFYQIASKFHK